LFRVEFFIAEFMSFSASRRFDEAVDVEPLPLVGHRMTFFAALGPEQNRLVSVGRYALRGVAQAQDLFTLERAR
jgi:hypothetical protein